VRLANLKDYSKAKACFEEYQRLYPEGYSREIVGYELALCYEGLGDRTKAVSLLQEGLSKFGGSVFAEDYRKKLAELQ